MAPKPAISASLEVLDHGDYRLVDAPPEARQLPECRLRVIAFAKANKGRWVEYKPDPNVETATVESLRNSALRELAGFHGQWNASVNKAHPGIVWLRYCGAVAS